MAPMGTKNLYENGPNSFFFFFQSYGSENGPESYSQIRFERFVTGLQTDLVPRFVCTSDTKTAKNGFRTRRNYYYIWPITLLLELEYIITSARNAAAIAKDMIELRVIVFYSREERGRWWQGPRCLRCSKLRRIIGGLGGLRMTPRRSCGCGACIPELTTRRHRAPWTVVMLRQPSQSIHTLREA